MKVILFSPLSDNGSQRLLREVEERTTIEQLDVCTSLPQLLATLATRNTESAILVLLAEDREHLLALHDLRDRLLDRKCILVLHDTEKETISLGHQLRPRFLTNFDQPPEHLGAVLSKMLKNAAEARSPFHGMSLVPQVQHRKNLDAPIGSEYPRTESKKPAHQCKEGVEK
jgi:hypothetical protein